MTATLIAEPPVEKETKTRKKATPKDTVFNVPVRFAELTRCAANENSRYAIGGVCVQRAKDGRVLGVVTDGHRLVIVAAEDTDGDTNGEGEGSAMFTSALLKDAAKMSRSDTFRLVIDGESKKPRIEIPSLYGPLVIHGGFVDGTFPPFRDVIPVRKDDEPIDKSVCFNPKSMSDICLVVHAISKGGDPAGLHWLHTKQNKAIKVVTKTDRFEITALCMPVASGNGFDPLKPQTW